MASQDNKKAPMKRGPKPETIAKRRKKRRRQLFEAAARLFAQNGFHQTTMQDVADEAGLGKGTLYEYVQSKQELLFFVMEAGLELIEERVSQAIEGVDSPSEKVRVGTEAHLRTLHRYRDAGRVISQEALGLAKTDRAKLRAIRQRYTKLWERMIGEGIDCGEFRDFDVKFLVETFMAMSTVWVGGGVIEVPRRSVKSSAEMLTGVLLEGIENRNR